MSSWHYAYFFPENSSHLMAEKGFLVMESYGLSLMGSARKLIATDESGHLEGIGDEISLGYYPKKGLEDLLAKGEQLLIEFNDENIIFSCSFATKANNPYISIGWSKSIFAQIYADLQSRYLDAIEKFALGINASYIVYVDDASYDFEDKFLEIDGIRVLDVDDFSIYGHGITSVSVTKKESKLPVGIDTESEKITKNGFKNYRPLSASRSR